MRGVRGDCDDFYRKKCMKILKILYKGYWGGGRGGGGGPPPKRAKVQVFDGVFGKSKKHRFLPPIFNESTVKIV